MDKCDGIWDLSDLRFLLFSLILYSNKGMRSLHVRPGYERE